MAERSTEAIVALVEAEARAVARLAEVARARVDTIRAIRALAEQQALDPALRAALIQRPYLLHPHWETFRQDASVSRIMEEAAHVAWPKEDDLALRNGAHLLVAVFLRSTACVTWDDLSRCLRYLMFIRSRIETDAVLGIAHVAGLIVADRLDDEASVAIEIREWRKRDIHVYSWPALLERAERAWQEWLDHLRGRAADVEETRTRLCERRITS